MGLPTSLVRRHNHLRALSALGLPLEKPAFPAVLQCPRCGQHTLQLFDDLLTDGIWLNCQGCSAHGDIIIFGAGLWKLSLPNTLAKFSETGLIAENEADKAVGDYDRYFKRKEAMENFLYDSESQVWNHGDDVIACRLRDLGVRHELEECQGLVGVAHYDQIAKICAEVGRPKPPRLRDDGPSLVFPFYDLPGRITGVLLLQYNNAYEAKQTYIPLSGSRKRKPEAGYYLLKAAWLAKQPSFKNTQFVFEDVLLAVKAQCTALSKGRGWMPVMASYTGPEAESYGTSWQSFSPATRIFHGHSPTPELISRACNAKGYVTPLPITRASITNDLLDIRRKAQTWQQTLQSTLVGANEMTAEAFAKRLTIPPDKLNSFLIKVEKAFSAGFRERVMLVANAPINAPLNVQKRWFIVERENGWWNQVGRQVSNFTPTILEVLHADTGEKIYKGTVSMNGEVYPFMDSAKKIERMGFLTYAGDVVARHGKLGIFDQVWDKKAHLLAMQLRTPKLVNVATKYGWDEHANVFRFARYEISHAGEVVKTHPWPGKKTEKDFPEPTPIAPLPIHELITSAHENSFVWAVAGAVITNLVAPILRKDYIATALPSESFEVAAKIGAALGCDVEKTTAFQKHVAGNFLEQKTADTAWPVVCSGAFNDEAFGPNIPRYFNRPLLLRVTKQTRAVAISYGWQSINGSPTRPAVDVSPLRAILPTYVQRILRNRMSMFATPGNLNDIILGDLHNWLLETYGTAFNLPHARSIVQYGEHAHTALMAEINDAILAGKIDVLPHPRTSKQNKNYVLQKKDYWWLNRRAVDRYFYSGRNVGPNWLAVIELLQKDGVYGGEEVIHNMPGVLVQSDWCEGFYTTPNTLPEKEIG